MRGYWRLTGVIFLISIVFFVIHWMTWGSVASMLTNFFSTVVFAIGVLFILVGIPMTILWFFNGTREVEREQRERKAEYRAWKKDERKKDKAARKEARRYRY